MVVSVHSSGLSSSIHKTASVPCALFGYTNDLCYLFVMCMVRATCNVSSREIVLLFLSAVVDAVRCIPTNMSCLDLLLRCVQICRLHVPYPVGASQLFLACTCRDEGCHLDTCASQELPQVSSSAPKDRSHWRYNSPSFQADQTQFLSHAIMELRERLVEFRNALVIVVVLSMVCTKVA